jgi:hypothetical protein
MVRSLAVKRGLATAAMLASLAIAACDSDDEAGDDGGGGDEPEGFVR